MAHKWTWKNERERKRKFKEKYFSRNGVDEPLLYDSKI